VRHIAMTSVGAAASRLGCPAPRDPGLTPGLGAGGPSGLKAAVWAGLRSSEWRIRLWCHQSAVARHGATDAFRNNRVPSISRAAPSSRGLMAPPVASNHAFRWTHHLIRSRSSPVTSMLASLRDYFDRRIPPSKNWWGALLCSAMLAVFAGLLSYLAIGSWIEGKPVRISFGYRYAIGPRPYRLVSPGTATAIYGSIASVYWFLLFFVVRATIQSFRMWRVDRVERARAKELEQQERRKVSCLTCDFPRALIPKGARCPACGRDAE
jgi:hypothetical protein